MIVYDEGGVTLWRGDCRDVLPELDMVDHVLTDPPYARDVYRRLAAVTHQDRDGVALMAREEIGYSDGLIAAVGAEIGRLTRRWAVVWSDVESTSDWRAALEAGGLRYVRTGAWVRLNSMPQFSGDRPAVGFEACVIAHGAAERMRWNGGGHAAVWQYTTERGRERADHPCPNPLALMLELIRQFTDPGDVILDPFAGSGTTLIAARLAGRRAIGIERDARYCEVAVGRLRFGVDGARQVAAGQRVLDL